MKKDNYYGYYAVFGENGIGVYDDYTRAKDQQPYLRKFNCKYFDSLADALNYAVEKYNELQASSDTQAFCVYPDEFPLNWCVRTKQLVNRTYREGMRR